MENENLFTPNESVSLVFCYAVCTVLIQWLLFSTSWCCSSVTYLLEICCLLWQ